MYNHQHMRHTMLEAASGAAKAVLAIYHSHQKSDVNVKEDGSPITQADMASHHIIRDLLRDAYPNIPVISEENDAADIITHTGEFFLVDPLDGTKGFIHQNGEFTVNIAYVSHLKPMIGVVIAPARNLVISANHQEGLWIDDHFYSPQQAKALATKQPIAMMSHRPDAAPWQKKLLEKHHIAQEKHCHSSLKFCHFFTETFIRLAILPHPTYEWDTAAMSVILATMGIGFYDEHGQPLTYGKNKFLNPLLAAY